MTANVEASPPFKGRLVMLVDNPIEGDSRVQKSAVSAARAGWDVVVIGCGPTEREWRVGAARAMVVRVKPALRSRPHLRRHPLLRRPLAYRPGATSAYRSAWVKARHAGLRERRDRHAEVRAAAGRAGVLLGELRLLPGRVAGAVTSRWVRLRVRETAAITEIRKDMDRPLDRITNRFWRTVLGRRCWRRLEPGLWDYEHAFGKVIDRLEPDLIHAHDYRMLGVGARAKIRAMAKGRPVKLVWDAHEYLPGLKPPSRATWLPAHCGYELEYSRYADAVVTVSAPIAELLRVRHRLPELPSVVLNAPAAADIGGGGDAAAAATSIPGLRERCGIGPGVPLLVYVGGAAAHRGLGLMVEGLARIDGAHLAFVVNTPDGPYLRSLLDEAARLGVRDRIHPMPYVPYWHVPAFVSAADVGVIAMDHRQNHELALPNKFFEYAHGRLPVVVSDVATLARTVREIGQGEVFAVGDVDGFVTAARKVLADPGRYRAAYDVSGLLDQWTWETQAEVLERIYDRLLAGPAAAPRIPGARLPSAAEVERPRQAGTR
jgi:glycosyltransferase involved in cell wall biosynthesis